MRKIMEMQRRIGAPTPTVWDSMMILWLAALILHVLQSPAQILVVGCSRTFSIDSSMLAARTPGGWLWEAAT